MELLQLKYFCDAAISENFSSTAKKFEVPPSDISQSVRRLEKELGAQLFLRQPNRIRLNEKGREFYEKISKALEAIDEGVSAVTDDGSCGRIKICINSNRRIVMGTLEKYRKAHPDVEIITTHFSGLEEGDFDVIIDSDSQKLSGYKRILLLSEKIMLAVKSDSKYAKLKRVNIQELANEPFITMSHKSDMYAITESICQEFGFKPKIAMQSDDPFYVRKCVELGLGVAFVPDFSWRGQFSNDVVLKEVGDYTRETFIYTSASKYTPKRVENFIKMLLSEVK